MVCQIYKMTLLYHISVTHFKEYTTPVIESRLWHFFITVVGVVVIEDCTTCEVAKSISPVFILSITVSLLCPVRSAIARTVVFTLYLNATNLDIERRKEEIHDS